MADEDRQEGEEPQTIKLREIESLGAHQAVILCCCLVCSAAFALKFCL
jgi:hypothetical protein